MKPEKVLPPIIAAACASIIGFGAGAILNRPSRDSVNAEIESMHGQVELYKKESEGGKF